MQKGWTPFLQMIATLVAVFSAFQAKADAIVTVDLNGLSPSTVYITPGEAVFWLQDDDNGPYEIQSDHNAWLPFLLTSPGDEQGVRFNQVGTYTYMEAVNFTPGTVVVFNNGTPTVTITNPLNNAVFSAPASFTFGVDAADPDADGLSDVEFYVGTNLVDDVFFDPFATSVTNLDAGTYILTAIAYDNLGASATNSVTITVQNQSGITLGGAAIISGQFQFTATGLTIGRTNILQSSTNFPTPAGWIPIATNVATSTSASFTNALDGSRKVFRLLERP
jgi:plastocyanin